MLPRHFQYFYCSNFKKTFDKNFMRKASIFKISSKYLLCRQILRSDSRWELDGYRKFVLNNSQKLAQNRFFYLLSICNLQANEIFNFDNLYNIPLSANFTKWSNILKQFVAKLPTNCLSVFDHFVGLAVKGVRINCCLMITNQSYISQLLTKNRSLKKLFCHFQYLHYFNIKQTLSKNYHSFRQSQTDLR